MVFLAYFYSTMPFQIVTKSLLLTITTYLFVFKIDPTKDLHYRIILFILLE